MNEPQPIRLIVRQGEEESIIQTHAHAYRNLMVLLNNSFYLEGFGECGGQGRCATCLVTLSDLSGEAHAMERNERATLNKMGLADSEIRLSCQCLITPALQGAVVTIVEDGATE